MDSGDCVHDKAQKDKARKRGSSLRKKTVQLGTQCDIFAALVYWNPTHRRLDAAVHLPRGQEIPDVNTLFRNIANSPPTERQTRRTRRRHQRPQRAPVLDSVRAESPQELDAEKDSTEEEGHPLGGSEEEIIFLGDNPVAVDALSDCDEDSASVGSPADEPAAMPVSANVSPNLHDTAWPSTGLPLSTQERDRFDVDDPEREETYATVDPETDQGMDGKGPFDEAVMWPIAQDTDPFITEGIDTGKPLLYSGDTVVGSSTGPIRPNALQGTLIQKVVLYLGDLVPQDRSRYA